MKIGNLVCYNAGGMKHRTLGLVLDIKTRPARLQFDRPGVEVLIQWAVIGEYMPRKAFTRMQSDCWGKDISPGAMIWHEAGDWFEVVQ